MANMTTNIKTSSLRCNQFSLNKHMQVSTAHISSHYVKVLLNNLATTYLSAKLRSWSGVTCSCCKWNGTSLTCQNLRTPIHFGLEWQSVLGRWRSLSVREPQHLSTKWAVPACPYKLNSWFITVKTLKWLDWWSAVTRLLICFDMECRWNRILLGFNKQKNPWKTCTSLY